MQMATVLYSWPGGVEEPLCDKHAASLREVAEQAGIPVQLVPLDDWGRLPSETPWKKS